MGLNYHAIQTATVRLTVFIRLQVKLTFHKLCLFRHSFTLTGCFHAFLNVFLKYAGEKPKGVNKMERMLPLIS